MLWVTSPLWDGLRPLLSYRTLHFVLTTTTVRYRTKVPRKVVTRRTFWNIDFGLSELDIETAEDDIACKFTATSFSCVTDSRLRSAWKNYPGRTGYVFGSRQSRGKPRWRANDGGQAGCRRRICFLTAAGAVAASAAALHGLAVTDGTCRCFVWRMLRTVTSVRCCCCCCTFHSLITDRHRSSGRRVCLDFWFFQPASVTVQCSSSLWVDDKSLTN